MVWLTAFAALQYLYLGTLISPLFGVAGDRAGYRAVLACMRATYAVLAACLAWFALLPVFSRVESATAGLALLTLAGFAQGLCMAPMAVLLLLLLRATGLRMPADLRPAAGRAAHRAARLRGCGAAPCRARPRPRPRRGAALACASLAGGRPGERAGPLSGPAARARLARGGIHPRLPAVPPSAGASNPGGTPA